jgi:hypothetical protein
MIEAVSKGIRGALVANTAVTTLVATRIYNTQADESAALPYIVFQYVSGGSTNDTPRDALNVVFQVVAVAGRAQDVRALERLIRMALHNVQLTLDDGWTAYDCQHENAFYMIDNVDRKQYYMSGGEYRVRAARGA